MIYLLITWLAAPILWLRLKCQPRNNVRQILLIQTAKIGDFVATRPVIFALRLAYPDARLTVLLHSATEPLAKHMQEIDRCVVLPKHGYKGWLGKRWLLTLLRQESPDVVCVLSPNLATFLLPFWVGVSHRISVLPDRRQGVARFAWPFLTHGEAHIPGRLFVETACQALTGLGLEIEYSALQKSLYCTEEGQSRCRALLNDHSAIYIGLGIGAGNRLKALKAEQLKFLCTHLLNLPRRVLVLIDTSQDTQIAQWLLEQFPDGYLIDTTGKWSLEDLPALLSGLHGFVGVDSGATYIADAQGIPVLDLMGPADADDQRPTGQRAVIIRSSVSCAPCSHAFDAPYRCHQGERRCLLFDADNQKNLLTMLMNF